MSEEREQLVNSENETVKNRINQKMSLLAGGDIFLYVLAIIFITLFLQKPKGERGNEFQLFINDSLIQSSSFNSSTTEYSIGDAQFSVESTDSSVGFAANNCPTQVCVHSHWISRSGEEIICLPHRIVLKVKGERIDVDIIAQ